MKTKEELYNDMTKKFSKKEITFEELKNCYSNTIFENKNMKKEKTEEELKKIFLNVVENFMIDDDGFFYIDDLEYITNQKIIIEKIQNTIELLNETKKRSSEEFNIIMKRDICDDIWYIV